jgi:hypothetical protein
MRTYGKYRYTIEYYSTYILVVVCKGKQCIEVVGADNEAVLQALIEVGYREALIADIEKALK